MSSTIGCLRPSGSKICLNSGKRTVKRPILRLRARASQRHRDRCLAWSFGRVRSYRMAWSCIHQTEQPGIKSIVQIEISRMHAQPGSGRVLQQSASIAREGCESAS
jgi:hypothetical protein